MAIISDSLILAATAVLPANICGFMGGCGGMRRIGRSSLYLNKPTWAHRNQVPAIGRFVVAALGGRDARST